MAVPRQYRPNVPSTADPWLKEFARQIPDLLHDLRQNYTPRVLFAKGTATVPVAVADSGLVQITLDRQGSWVLQAAVCLVIAGAGDFNQPFTLSLAVGGILQPQLGIVQSAAAGTLMMHQSWQVPVPPQGSATAALLIHKASAATGTSSVDGVNSTLTATWQGLG